MRFPTCIALVLLAAPFGRAQEEQPAPAPEPAETDARALFAAAILKHKNAPEHVARAVIEPEGGGGNFGVVFGVGGGGAGEPFQGEVEIWRGEDGATVVVSKEDLPGFALYVGEDRTVRRATFEDSPPSLAELEAELVPLLDPARFAKHLMAAKLEVKRDAATGDWVFEGPVSRNLVKVTKGDNPFPAKRVLRAEAQVVLSAEGVLKSFRVKVVHNDPMQEMMRGRRVVVGLGGQPAKEEEEEEEPHEVEGGSVGYRLEFGTSAPSGKAREFKEEVGKILGG